MSEGNNIPQTDNVYSANDALDINELASLNDDISPEFIEQLQNQLVANTKGFSAATSDADLFEEVQTGNSENTSTTPVPRISIDDNIDDNFIKKYKAKLNKQQVAESTNDTDKQKNDSVDSAKNNIPEPKQEKSTEEQIPKINNEIENLTAGNIIEKPIVKEQISYNDSLDFLDENVKYSKYVIYIDPENTDFIEGLTVKERKNLINKILREQDDIAITKKRLSFFQTVVKHAIVAIITISISIPVVYWTINASLEATINNHRRSQKIFKTLYREKGKIKSKQSIN